MLGSQAFRFFDQRLQNKLSKIDFNKGLLLFKMVLESDELSRIFNFFDQDCDGYISLQEFGILYSADGQDPNDSRSHNNSQITYSKGKAPTYSSQVPVTERGFGNVTLPSDNIQNVINYQFQRDFVSFQNQKLHSFKQHLKDEKRYRRDKDTKAFKLMKERNLQKKEANWEHPECLNMYGGFGSLPPVPKKLYKDNFQKLLNQSQHTQLADLKRNKALDRSVQVLHTKEGKNDLLSQYFSQKKEMNKI